MLSDHMIELPETGEEVRFLGVRFLRHRNFYKCLDAEGLADEIEVRALIAPDDREVFCNRLRSRDPECANDIEILMRLIFNGLIAGVRYSDAWMQVQNILWAAAAEILEELQVEHLNDLLMDGTRH